MTDFEIDRRKLLQTTGGSLVALGGVSTVAAADDWGDYCGEAPVVDGTGEYSGTLETSDDQDVFKIQVDHGEYLEIDAVVPNDAVSPRIGIVEPSEGHEYTLRNGENVTIDQDIVELEPGIDGSFELWAESDVTFCVRVYDIDSANFPYEWQFNAEKQTSASPDEDWGNYCDEAPVVDGTGDYSGTLVSPDDAHYFKMEVDHGEYLTVDTFVPIDAEDPRIGIVEPSEGHEYTLRNEENVTIDQGSVELEPGIDGSFELWAESDVTFCFSITNWANNSEYPYDWQFNSEKRSSAPPDEDWGNYCDEAPVVDGTGDYSGTLVSPRDTHYFKMQVNHGEYLQVDAFAPIDANNPQIGVIEPSENYEYTLRNEENVTIDRDIIELESGIDGSFELWAESDVTLCFQIADGADNSEYPYDWQFSSEKRSSALPDEDWGNYCDEAPAVDIPGRYSGTLVSPQDAHYFRFQLDEGDTLDVAAFVPTAASSPRLGIVEPSEGHEYTLKNGENVTIDRNTVELEPGIDGSFELVAEEANVFCIRVRDWSSEGGYPHDWDITLGNPPDEAYFDVGIDSVNDPVIEGETLEVETSVTNTGAAAGEQALRLHADGTEVDTTTLTLDFDESVNEVLEYQTAEGDGDDVPLAVDTDGNGSEASYSAAVEPEPEEAYFEIGIDEVNDPVTEGETLEVTASVTNTGGTSDEQALRLHADETEVDTTTLALDGGESRDGVTLTYQTVEGDADDVSLAVDTDGNGGEETYTAAVQAGTDEPSVADYADEETGRVGTDGLREAIGDWRASTIGAALLRDVITAWRSGEQVR